MAAINVKGLPKARAVLRASSSICKGGNAFMDPLNREFGRALSEIQRQAIMLTPVDEGTLRGSAQNSTMINGQSIRGRITFGGMASKYAEVQHEREDFNHPKGGTHHFLVGENHSAWDANAPRVFGILASKCATITEDAMRENGAT